MVDPPIGAASAVDAPTGWGAFLRERFQLPMLLVLATLQAVSAQYVVETRLDVTGLVLAVTGVATLLALLRLMDELKDLDKDRIAHPERPLPRGAVGEADARRVLRWGVVAVAALAALLAIGRNPVAGLLLLVCLAYALLMYREFFASRFLASHPFGYAITHQIVVLPIYAFATATAFPRQALSTPVLWFGLTGLGASFAFEVCRKLDPAAHPVRATYLTVAGPRATVAAVVAAACLTAFAAYRLDLHPIVWPAAALVVASLAIVFVRPERFERVEVAVALLVLAQVLAPTLARLWQVLR